MLFFEFSENGVIINACYINADPTATLPVLNFNPMLIKQTNRNKYFVMWKYSLIGSPMMLFN